MPSQASRTTASSNRGQLVTSVHTPFGLKRKTVQYDAKSLREEMDKGLAAARQHVADKALEKEKEKFKHIHRSMDDNDDDDFPATDIFCPVHLEPEDLLGGGVPLDISHAGGELLEILHLPDEDRRPRYIDGRTRRDHVENCNQAFRRQMPSIVEAYLAWDAGLGAMGLEAAHYAADCPDSSGMRLQVIDVFCSRTIQTNVKDGPKGIAALLVKCGLMPCAPLRPSLAVTTRLLELYQNVQSRVNQALGQGAPDWQLHNACPACTYKLEGEAPLVYELLFTMDGNDSLKRVVRKDTYDDFSSDHRDQTLTSVVKEVMDSRRVLGNYYLERETVDCWAKDCITACMWGVFDETGIFLALCRHGFGLVVADMAQSGELAKYPLAVVEALLNTFGPKLGGGYNIGCRFGATLAKSALGEWCQLSHLATYVEGMGLEDLEGCERFFSKSNVLASSVRYASTFHRRQRIAQFIQHMDVAETSQKLSEFLVNNYKQALSIIQGKEELRRTMRNAQITSTTVFHEWLEEEKSYLKGLRKEPEEEKHHIDYYEELIKLAICKDQIDKLARESFIPYKPPIADRSEGSGIPQKRKHLPQQRLGLQKLHASEQLASTEAKVHSLKDILGVTTRWQPNTPEWNRVKTLADHRNY
ncbi:hypothetical protein NP233_g9627 [Leucocoprinus birnbaumii]|uniref:Uncharacterized protein n=1 Tax=Leucocoprinus birnbaumii TaxID=56174 RepID=A0AAD5VK95_9AGAR|nr:hypothetical protein NP233_g9627 [Leucocoprinus birnbaumii]